MGDLGYRSEVVDASANGHCCGQPHHGKGIGGKVSKAPSSSKSWKLSDPELKRKKRVASYKVYAVEGRVKASFRRGMRWIKDKCNGLIHGW